MSKVGRKSKAKTKTKAKKVQEECIDFETFYWFAIKEKKVRLEQKNEIKVFFSSKGLKDKETKQKFYDILKQY